MDGFKCILLALVSTLAGGVVGYFAAIEKYKIDYDLACRNYERKLKDEHEDREEEVKKALELYSGGSKPDLRDLASKYNDKDLNRFVASREAPDDDEEDPEESYDEPIDIPRENPYVITSREFDETKNEYDKVYMTYYEQDDVLIEDDYIDSVIVDVDTILGPDALSMFGWDEDEPKVVCVRNENLHTDYYVGMVPGSYAELVQGIKDPIERRRTHDSL